MGRVAALWKQYSKSGPSLGSYGSPPPGIPFLQDSLTNAFIIVEVAFGANVNSSEPQSWNWFDITTDVRQADGSNISLTSLGRSDEASQSSPANCSFQLDNTSGNYTAYHPGSKWWPNVIRNTPIRVRLFINGTYYTRFQGQVDGWVPSWDVTCNLAVITVSASGKMRQLNQGKTPLRSALYRALSTSSPIVYWPCEDGSNSVSCASPIAGVNPLIPPTTAVDFSAAASAPIQFAAESGPSGSDNLPLYQNGSYMHAVIPYKTTTSWRMDCVVKTPIITGGASPTQFATVMQLGSTGDILVYEVDIYRAVNGGIDIKILDKNGVVSNSPVNTLDAGDGNWHYVSVRAVQNGAGIDMTAYVDQNSTTWTITPATLQPLNEIITSISAPSNQFITSLGHVSIWEPTTTLDGFSPASGWIGETATARLARLCQEQSITADIRGSSDTLMGPQSVDIFESLLRDCETTDDGLLVDGFGAGISFFTRQYRYNANASMSPDVALGQVDDPFEPIDDDQRNRNSVKVDRKNGSSSTVTDTSGPLGTDTIGLYDSLITVNSKDDSGLQHRAGWEVRKGTIQGFRHPTLGFNLAAIPALIPYWLSTTLSGRVDVLNVSSKAIQHPIGTVSLLVEGYSETLTPFDWGVVINCSLYDPWRVALIEGSGDNTWLVDAGSSTLVSPALVGDTSITVQTTDGIFWSTSAGDYPRAISVGGIQVTVTAVGAASGSNQAFTVNALRYALPAGSAVTLWHPAMIAL